MYCSGPKSIDTFLLTLLCIALLVNEHYLLFFMAFVVVLSLLNLVDLKNRYKCLKSFGLQNLF